MTTVNPEFLDRLQSLVQRTRQRDLEWTRRRTLSRVSPSVLRREFDPTMKRLGPNAGGRDRD